MASIDDFQYLETGETDALRALIWPICSLYCLDHNRREAIFVRTPDTDPRDASFFYQAQYQAARELLAVPYEVLHELADGLTPPESRLVMIHSVGRCGSTLVSKVFALADETVCLSEPDVFTQLETLRGNHECPETMLRALARSCLRILQVWAQRGQLQCFVAVKFRGSVIGIADLLYEAFPQAKLVFIYRHARTWAQSAARAFRVCDPAMVPYQLENQRTVCRLWPEAASYIPTHQEGMATEHLLVLMWIAIIKCFLRLQCSTTDVFITRYEDLKKAPEAVVEGVLAFCGVTQYDPRALCSIFARDAQAGTSLARENVLSVSTVASVFDESTINRLIAQYAPDLAADMILPGTFQICAEDGVEHLRG